MPVDVALMLLGVALFPVVGMGLLLWLTHLEETLPRDVRSTLCSPSPPPVLAVRVRQPEPPVVSVTRGPEPEVAQPQDTGAEWSRQARPTTAGVQPAG